MSSIWTSLANSLIQGSTAKDDVLKSVDTPTAAAVAAATGDAPSANVDHSVSTIGRLTSAVMSGKDISKPDEGKTTNSIAVAANNGIAPTPLQVNIGELAGKAAMGMAEKSGVFISSMQDMASRITSNAQAAAENFIGIGRDQATIAQQTAQVENNKAAAVSSIAEREGFNVNGDNSMAIKYAQQNKDLENAVIGNQNEIKQRRNVDLFKDPIQFLWNQGVAIPLLQAKADWENKTLEKNYGIVQAIGDSITSQGKVAAAEDSNQNATLVTAQADAASRQASIDATKAMEESMRFQLSTVAASNASDQQSYDNITKAASLSMQEHELKLQDALRPMAEQDRHDLEVARTQGIKDAIARTGNETAMWQNAGKFLGLPPDTVAGLNPSSINRISHDNPPLGRALSNATTGVYAQDIGSFMQDAPALQGSIKFPNNVNQLAGMINERLAPLYPVKDPLKGTKGFSELSDNERINWTNDTVKRITDAESSSIPATGGLYSYPGLQHQLSKSYMKNNPVYQQLAPLGNQNKQQPMDMQLAFDSAYELVKKGMDPAKAAAYIGVGSRGMTTDLWAALPWKQMGVPFSNSHNVSVKVTNPQDVTHTGAAAHMSVDMNNDAVIENALRRRALNDKVTRVGRFRIEVYGGGN